MNKIIKNTLLEKVDYSKDPEAPMTIGTKLLKKIDKEWGKDSDIYSEVEDLLIAHGSGSPKRLAMALRRVLSNYDMWEAPYKGLVNKIEKWQFVNESKVNEAVPAFVGRMAMRAAAGYAGRKLANKFRNNEDTLERETDTKYYRPIDVEKLYNAQKQRGSKISKFEKYVVEAAMWARARSNNYHGYHSKWPAVEYKNGKFYAQTIHDGMTEVPFNYSVMTPKWLMNENAKISSTSKNNINENLHAGDYYDDAYNAIKNLLKSKKWDLDDVADQIYNGDIYYKDVMDEMGIKMENLLYNEDEDVCEDIMRAISDYFHDSMKKNINEAFENTDPKFVKLCWEIRSLVKKYQRDAVIFFDNESNEYFWDWADEYDQEYKVVATARYNSRKNDVIMEK